MVFTASLDNPQDHAPTYHLGIESAMPWLTVHDDLPRTRCEDSPSLVEAYRSVGQSVPDQAIAACSEAINSGKWDGKGLNWAHFNRGISYLQINRPAEALADFERVIVFDPGDGAAYANRGFAKLQLRQPAEAIGDFQQSEELGLVDPAMFMRHAIALRVTGDLRGSANQITKALAANPGLISAYNDRANTWCKLGEVDRAIADWNRWLPSNPENARREQAWLKKQGFYDGAVDGQFGPASRAAQRAYAEAGCPGL